MEPWHFWQEIYHLVIVGKLNPSLDEAFDASRVEVENLIFDIVGTGPATSLTKADAETLEGETQGNAKEEGSPFLKAHIKELTRFRMIRHRICELYDLIIDKPNYLDNVDDIIRRLEDFTIRFFRFRRKEVAREHLSPAAAEEIGMLVDLEADEREIAKVYRQIEYEQTAGGDMAEEELVARLQDRSTPTISPIGNTITILHPRWVCRLEYGDDQAADSVSNVLSRRYHQHKKPSIDLRREPTLQHLYLFLAAAHPPEPRPSTVWIEIAERDT